MAKKAYRNVLYDFVIAAKEPLLGAGQYDEWTRRTMAIEADQHLTHAQAVVEASKEFTCLGRLLAESGLLNAGSEPAKGGPFCEGKEQSYIENVRWAVSAAGQAKMTGKTPRICPNSTAWYLYQQAIDDPGKFISIMNTAENKASGGEEVDTEFQRACKKSIEELDLILEGLQ